MHRALSAGAIILLLLVSSRAAGQFQAVSERWQARYSGPGNYHDELSDMTVDAAGNVYITGYNYGKDTDRDYVTVKYNGQGQQLWSRRYNGPGNNRDMAEAVTVDQEQNVYVAGYSYGSSANYDFTTIKYDRNGNELWVARYNGPGNSHEYAAAAAVDDRGDVYVTGYLQLSAEQTDCITVKYDAAGAEQWVRRYNGPANGYDSGRVIKMDRRGNVIVSGYSEGILTSRDYLTIKYDPNGIELWTARYTGPSQGYDEVNALVVDAEDNIYVTGRSYGSGSGTDILTIKYNASGVEQWAQRYAGPAWTGGDQGKALALDDGENIYVCGISKGAASGYDYVTIKYRTDNGSTQWVKRYEAQADWESPIVLVVDGAGNVYFSGEGCVNGAEVDYITIKYDTDGKAQWLSWYDGPVSGADRVGGMGIDELGYIYVSGVSMAEITQQDITTIKYDPDGEQQWTARYNGEGISDDQMQALAIDQEGAVYVTGCVRSGLNYDYATVKYDSQGNEQWVRFYGQEHWNEQAQALGIDSKGGVCVTGNRGSHCVTVKYDDAGNELWAVEHQDALSSSDYAYSLAIDSHDNILIGGYSYQAGAGDNNYRVIKYDPNGYEMWSAGYNGPANSSDRAYTIKTDHLDNVIITGYSYSSDTSCDFATVKFDADGNQLWAARYNGTGNSSDYPQALTVDGTGNVYVTGHVYNSGAGHDYATIKYDPNGIELWAVCYDGPAHASDYAQAITVDDQGNVYVTGYSYGSGTGYDFATIKYNRHGVEQWVVRHNDPINNGDYAQAIAQDGENGIYVSGYSYVDGAADYVTIKYTSDANQVWTTRYDGPADGIDDIPKALALDRRGNTYVSGVSGGVGTDQDFLTIKYSQLQMMAADQPRPIEIRNLKVKAAKRDPNRQGPWEDSFNLLGAFDVLEEEINAADYIYVTLWNAQEIIFRGLLPFEPEKFKKGKYTVKGPPGGMTRFMFNLNKTKPIFRIKAQKVNLTGLNSPVILELEMGNYYGIGLAGEGAQDYMLMGLAPEQFKDNINGRNPLPMKLMLGYADALRVDYARLKHNNKTGDSLYVRGALAVWDRAVDLTKEQVTFRWGQNDFTETIEKGNFKNINGKYIYKKSKSSNEQNDAKKIVLAIFDLQKCVFVISVKKAQIESQTQTVPFAIEFGGFDRVVYYTLDDKN